MRGASGPEIQECILGKDVRAGSGRGRLQFLGRAWGAHVQLLSYLRPGLEAGIGAHELARPSHSTVVAHSSLLPAAAASVEPAVIGAAARLARGRRNLGPNRSLLLLKGNCQEVRSRDASVPAALANDCQADGLEAMLGTVAELLPPGPVAGTSGRCHHRAPCLVEGDRKITPF